MQNRSATISLGLAGIAFSSIGGRVAYAPLDLRPDDTFSRFLVGRGLFWARMEKGFLSILPQRNALGYDIGYNGGGPHALTAYLTQVVGTDGRKTAAGATYEQGTPRSPPGDRAARRTAARTSRRRTTSRRCSGADHRHLPAAPQADPFSPGQPPYAPTPRDCGRRCVRLRCAGPAAGRPAGRVSPGHLPGRGRQASSPASCGLDERGEITREVGRHRSARIGH